MTRLEDVTLIEMPQYVEPDPAMPSPDPITGETPSYEPTIAPKRATPVPIEPEFLDALLARRPIQLVAIQPWDVQATAPTWAVELYDDGTDDVRMTLPSFVAIGAIVDVRRWPAGGTHVALEWRAS